MGFRGYTNTLKLIVCVLTVILAGSGYAADYEGRLIGHVETEGNHWIDTKTILHTVLTAPGKTYSSRLIRKDIKALYRLGFFEMVEVEAEERPDKGLTVIFRVKEKPLITEIIITGNKKIESSRLRERLTLKVRTILDEAKVKRNAALLENEYKINGYQDVQVIPEYEQVLENEVKVTFRIIEGLEVVIRDIEFDGNKVYKDKILRKRMKTKPYHGLISIFTSRGKYSEQQLQEDIASVEEFYQNNGYIKVNIGQYRIEKLEQEKNKRFIKIIVPVSEGDLYRFGEIILDGNKLFTNEHILDKLQSDDESKNPLAGLTGGGLFGGKKKLVIREGETYSREKVREGISFIAELYGEKGYIAVNTYPDIQIHDETFTVDIIYRITEGEPHYLSRIEFSGNDHTRDKVLRRELKILEGELFNTKKLRASIASLYYLGFLENIDTRVKPSDDDPTQMNLTILVDDARRDQFTFGGGFSTSNKFFGQLGFTSRNILGLGLEGDFNAQIGEEDQFFYVNLTNRYMFDSDWFGSLSGFNQRRDLNEFYRESTGGSLTVGKYLNRDRNILFRTRYQYEIVNVDLDDDVEDPLLIEAEGRSSTSSINPFITRDTRDNRRDPSKGSRQQLSFEIAGTFLGGDNAFYKVAYDHQFYYPLHRRLILAFRGQIQYGNGYNGQDYPVFERFFLGGERSVRIFDVRSIGPKGDQGETLGGNKSLLFNTELIFPISGPLKFILFFDAGDVYAEHEDYSFQTLRRSAGAEIRFTIPNFWVPLRLIYGYNLDRYRGESANDFQFSIGTTF